ncbi:MAG: tRNA1(Val) (adenine(37)-N6)-methyltransferase [Bacteroidia bacterium]
MKKFRFKQFNVIQQNSAMKVGTDSVLLGCFAETGNAKSILDIGTGTGLLALMMAQKSEAEIDAVEMDEAAFEEAKENFLNSKWKERINIFHSPIQSFLDSAFLPDRQARKDRYDLIITNPPYFEHSKNYKIEDPTRSKARQDKELSLEELGNEIMKLISDEGKFWLILPAKESKDFEKIATEKSLLLQKRIFIKPKRSKPVNRMVMCFGKQKQELVESEFIIYKEDGKPTEEYFELTREFLLDPLRKSE